MSFLMASAVASQPRSAALRRSSVGPAGVEPAQGPGRQPHEVVGVLGHEDEVAVVADHVADGGRDDRLAGRHVFERLGRADRQGRLVDRPGHDADVEALEVGRQLVVGPLAEVVEVRPAGQRGGVDLDRRPDQHDRADARRVGQAGDQVVVEPLVDDAVIAEDRPRQARPGRSGTARLGVERPGEVAGVDGGGEAVDVRVPVALGLVERPAAGEDDVGPIEEPRLGLDQARRRPGEVGQLVHAVVDDHLARAQPIAISREHRRIEPADQRPAVAGPPRHNPRPAPRDRSPPRAGGGPDHGHAPAHRQDVQPGRTVVEEGSSSTITGHSRASRERRCCGRW